MKLVKEILCCLLVFGLLALGAQSAMADALSDRTNALIKSADAYAKQGNIVAALQQYDKALSMRPGDLAIYYQRGLMFGRVGHYTSAINDFSLIIQREASSRRKRFPSARKYRAEGLVGLGQYQMAIEEYKAQLRQGSGAGNGKIWYYLAETYALMHRNDLALDAIKRGLATGSHWSGKMENLRTKILTGQKIVPHKPFSN
ncbi:tetratricopeptide repeat protein [Syntrophotalea acetylenica]|uniref:tetratricopeptide repeat protein n=1 Tax=Syntrophotalea acetylenica TaxID=29542 RepID=UPI002A370C1A|nr:tetratricopeptide repeat protein [Syntrophotalea acetylenica]MDY0263344.1 tetratricopeptide repeat protein [Syntrophotalea acetylenica]